MGDRDSRLLESMTDMEEQLENRPSDFDAVYESIKNSPEAVSELNDIMNPCPCGSGKKYKKCCGRK